MLYLSHIADQLLVQRPKASTVLEILVSRISSEFLGSDRRKLSEGGDAGGDEESDSASVAVQLVGEFALDEHLLDGVLAHLNLMEDVAAGSHCLSLQPALPLLNQRELQQVPGEFVADSEAHSRTVAITEVHLHLSVGVEAPLVPQTGHFDVLQEARVFASLVLLVNLLDSGLASCTFFPGRPEGVSRLERRIEIGEEGAAEIEGAFVSFERFEVCPEGVDLIEDGFGFVLDPYWPWELRCLDGGEQLLVLLL